MVEPYELEGEEQRCQATFLMRWLVEAVSESMYE
jgi:hypothetical protein